MIRTRVPSPMYTVPPFFGVSDRSFSADPPVKPCPGATKCLAMGQIRNRFYRNRRLLEMRLPMGLVLLLLVLALLFGGIGLAASALWWMLIIAGALLIASAFTGFGRRSTW